MKNLTEKQEQIIAEIKSEFLKINTAETSTDILSLIDKAVNEKHNLRKELEIIDMQNRKSIETIKNEILATLQTICDKYRFTLKCKKYINDNEYLIEITYNNYFKDKKNYPGLMKEANALLILPIEYKDNIKYVKSPVPVYMEMFYKGKYNSKEEFIQYFVNETIKVLKSEI